MISDRLILLLGLILKVVGESLYLLLFGKDKGVWQPFVGFIICINGSIFCITSLITLFTKVLRSLCSASTIGYLWSFPNTMPAVVQLMLTQKIMDAYSTWTFMIFVAPTIMALLITITPYGWRILDASSAHTEQMLAAASVMKSK